MYGYIKHSCGEIFNPLSFLPQSSSSELSRQSFSPLHRSSAGIQMLFRHVQSDSKQFLAAGQFSSSEPVGHWICPSQRAKLFTQPTESTQENWPGGHSEEPGREKKHHIQKGKNGFTEHIHKGFNSPLIKVVFSWSKLRLKQSLSLHF